MLSLPVIRSSTRRDFLAKCSAAAACAVCPKAFASPASAAGAAALIPTDKPKIHLVFTHPDPKIQGWPYQGYDYESRKTRYAAALRSGCPNIEFIVASAETAEQAKALMAANSDVDGYLVYLFGIPSSAPDVFAYSGKPAVLVDDLYGGTGRFLGLYPAALAKGMPVAGVSSTRIEDVIEALKAFECMKKLRSSTLLDATPRDLTKPVALYKESLGLTIRPVSADELNAAYEKADRGEAEQWARAWTKGAKKVVEPSQAEIQKSAAMYVGMRNLMAEHKAQGIAVDCLTLFYGGKMTAYPCLGFFQLNNDGLVGACEADLESASTMLLMTYLTGRPGYISDPVIDTSKNQIIYAHCVASNKVYGPNGPANPYHIRDHSEDRKGAAVRSLMPLGETTTTLKLVPAQKKVVMHRARTVENIDEDRACRTKLAATVTDARKLMAEWDFGWHRVTVYGDYKVPVETVSSLLGFRVILEG
ncbi:MAG: twin-arginine translocation signal domain-containing protein [Bryobacteraceae bacterium]|nr:twin-arginine translocation signal domain-containing protein [Bryobacteraceae bacterium]